MVDTRRIAFPVQTIDSVSSSLRVTFFLLAVLTGSIVALKSCHGL